MKKYIWVLVTLLVGITSSGYCFAENRKSADVVLSNQDLMNMSPDARNIIFSEMKKLEKTSPANSAEVLSAINHMDVESFKAKAAAIADALIVFCDKLGVKVNEFIYTPVGMIAVWGVIYKLGAFGSIWSFVKGMISLSIFTYILYGSNKKKVIVVKKYDADGKVVSSADTVVQKFSPFSDGMSVTDKFVYNIIVSFICVAAIVITIVNM